MPLAGLVLVGLVAVLVPGVGSVVNGARRWIIIGGQGIQPSEFAKLAAVVLVAALIVRRPREIESPAGFARLVAIGIVPAGLLIMLEPDLGTTLVLVVAVAAVLVAAGARLRYLFSLVAAGCLAVLALIVVEPYRLERLVTFFDPWKDPQGSGFQATQSLISIASGRIFGVGLGNSVQKFGFLPEQGTDMITGIIGEELGLIGLVVLLALYVSLAWTCFRIALNCKELFGKLLATGITAIILGQACINVGRRLGAAAAHRRAAAAGLARRHKPRGRARRPRDPAEHRHQSKELHCRQRSAARPRCSRRGGPAVIFSRRSPSRLRPGLGAPASSSSPRRRRSSASPPTTRRSPWSSRASHAGWRRATI